MSNFCLPPAGTPSGMDCVLLGADIRMTAKWVSENWEVSNFGMEVTWSPGFAADLGFKFHGYADSRAAIAKATGA